MTSTILYGEQPLWEGMTPFQVMYKVSVQLQTSAVNHLPQAVSGSGVFWPACDVAIDGASFEGRAGDMSLHMYLSHKCCSESSLFNVSCFKGETKWKLVFVLVWLLLIFHGWCNDSITLISWFIMECWPVNVRRLREELSESECPRMDLLRHYYVDTYKPRYMENIDIHYILSSFSRICTICT